MGTVVFHSQYNAPWGSTTLPLNVDARITYSETYDTASNKTTIRITKIELKNNNDINFGSLAFFGSVAVNGSTLIDIDNETTIRTISLPANSSYQSLSSMPTSGTVEVQHNADGTGSFTLALGSSYLQASNYYFCGRYINGATFTPVGIKISSGTTVSVNLTARPRAASVTATNANFGSAVNITVAPPAGGSAYKYTIKSTCAGHSETIASKSSNTSFSWTPALATYGALIPNAKTATATITCSTYSGNTLVGSSTATCKLTFPSSAAPTITEADEDVASTNYLSVYGKYINGKSKIKVVLTPSFKYSATGAAATITVNGATYNFTTPQSGKYTLANSGVLSLSGTDDTLTASIQYSVQDSRGFSKSGSKTVSVYNYIAPRISKFTINRCDINGADNNAGDYLKVKYTVSVTSLNSQNSKTLKIYYKKTSASSWSSKTITMSGYSQSGTDYTIQVDTSSSYNIELRVQDDFTTTRSARTLSSATTHINHGRGVNGGIGIGKVCEYNKSVDLSDEWAVRQGGKPILSLPCGEEIPQGANIDSYTVPGSYTCNSAAIAASLSGTPPTTDSAFKLVVPQLTTADRKYQIALINNANCDILRRYWNGSTFGAWIGLQDTLSFPLAVSLGGTGATTIDGILSAIGLGGLGLASASAAASGSAVLDVGASTHGILITSGAASTMKYLSIFNFTSSGTFSNTAVQAASSISVSSSTSGKITISNSSSNVVFCIALFVRG